MRSGWNPRCSGRKGEEVGQLLGERVFKRFASDVPLTGEERRSLRAIWVWQVLLFSGRDLSESIGGEGAVDSGGSGVGKWRCRRGGTPGREAAVRNHGLGQNQAAGGVAPTHTVFCFWLNLLPNNCM